MRLHRRSLLAALAALPVAAAARADDSAAETALDAVFSAVGPPALAGGIVTREGLVWSGVRGVRRLGAPDRATLEDRWHLGSNTKAMTAATWARLVEAGLTDWGRPLTDVFPEIAADPAWTGVTLETVMAHRSGLRDDDVLPRGVRVAARDDARPLIEQRLDRVRAALSAPPGGTAGAYAYANINFVLAGAVIERLTGTPWETAIADRLFRPLGVTEFGFGAPTGDQPWGHQLSDGVSTPLDPALKPDNPPLMGPAGTVNIRLSDYARFLRMFLTEGGGVLRPDTLARLSTPPPGPGRPYGFGWLVAPDLPWARGPVLMHEGSNTLWHAVTMVDPAGGVAFFALSNDDSRGGPATQQLVRRLIADRTAAG